MTRLVDIAWPYRTLDRAISYDPEVSGAHEMVTVLEVSGKSDRLNIQLVKKTFDKFSHDAEAVDQCLQLVMITRSWLSSAHEKSAGYDISQETFTKILDIQGLSSFYSQTRADVVGLFTSSTSHCFEAGQNDSMNFALIYDAFLGLWARYDRSTGRWQGIFIISDTGLDLVAIATRLAKLAHTEMFLYHFAAEYTVDFLGIRSGELPQRIIQIERHSGHHARILRPAPATYEKFETLSADATAIANQISFYKGVIDYLAKDLIQFLQDACGKDSNEVQGTRERVTNLKRRIGSKSAYLSYLERRVERQASVIFHLVNKTNASTNLEVAHDMKRLAIAGKHDSSSMKILTAMATIFLPGAFIAALFSTNMFDWSASAGEPVVGRQFWIYWSVTLPLTLITVGLWTGWEFWRRRGQKREHNFVGTQDDGICKDIC